MAGKQSKVSVPEMSSEALLKPAEAFLLITTERLDGCLCSRASIRFQYRDSYTRGRCREFSMTVETSANRATQKAVNELHASAMAQIDRVKRQMYRHYNTPMNERTVK